MAQVDDLALVSCPQINAEVVAIHDRDHAKLLMPHNIIRVVRVGKGLLATEPAQSCIGETPGCIRPGVP